MKAHLCLAAAFTCERFHVARTHGFSRVAPRRVQNHHDRHPRPAVDPRYLAQLAHRLADECGLPLAVAHKRVMALAISAQPQERNAGFADRGRSRLDLRI
jgi:hypothetical protein